jgi:hypothetical protein
LKKIRAKESDENGVEEVVVLSGSDDDVELVDEGSVSILHINIEYYSQYNQGNEQDLKEHHDIEVPSRKPVKTEQARNIQTIFMDRLVVGFLEGGQVEKVKGCWCNVCR